MGRPDTPVIINSMNYDLIIIKLTKPRLKQVIAHHIAADPSISLQKALSLLDNLPMVYKKDLSFKELEQASLQLQKLGAVCRAVESKIPIESHKAGIQIPEKKVKEYKVPKQKPIKPYVKHKKSAETVSERHTSFGTSPHIQPVKKKKGMIINGIIIVGIVLLILTIFLVGKDQKVRIKPTGPVLAGKKRIKSGRVKGGTSKTTVDSNKKSKDNKREKGESPVTSAERSSDAYIDSAVQLCEGYECEIKFYRIALSFNQYNIRAWQGLIAAYRGVGKRAEAEKAEKQMKRLFGEKVFSVEEIIKPYGVLTKFDRGKNGVCRIEYHSHSLKKSTLEKETYYLIRALLTQQNCTLISLYASTGKGKGMLVRIGSDRFPSRISDYVKNASISFVE